MGAEFHFDRAVAGAEQPMVFGAQFGLVVRPQVLDFDEVLSFTSETNTSSRRVMEKIGMAHDPAGDFDHPGVPASSPLRPHVLYRLDRGRWDARTGETVDAHRNGYRDRS